MSHDESKKIGGKKITSHNRSRSKGRSNQFDFSNFSADERDRPTEMANDSYYEI